MPSVSKNQRKAAGMAEAIQEGKMKPKPGTPSAQMAASMNPADLREFATTPEKGLPAKAAQKPRTHRRAPKVKMVGEPVKKIPFTKK